MNFDINRYHFYVTKNQVIAVSTYGGKIVRGIAKCDPRDTSDIEKGKKIAAARCNLKVAQKRYSRASNKFAEAVVRQNDAADYLDRMTDYINDSQINLDKAYSELDEALEIE